MVEMRKKGIERGEIAEVKQGGTVFLTWVQVGSGSQGGRDKQVTIHPHTGMGEKLMEKNQEKKNKLDKISLTRHTVVRVISSLVVHTFVHTNIHMNIYSCKRIFRATTCARRFPAHGLRFYINMPTEIQNNIQPFAMSLGNIQLQMCTQTFINTQAQR